MKGTIKAALLALAVVAYAAPAYAVPGVDFFGYFRDGFAANSKGGGQTCFQTPTMDYKLRLGNECDNYGEWGLQATLVKDSNGAEFSAGLMFNYDQDTAQPTGTTNNFGIQQNYFKAKFPQWGGITFWGGKQYYERENIDMIDHFYLNTSDTGIGFENLATGFGNLSFSVFSYKPAGQANIAGYRPDVRLNGLPLGGFGTLTIDANVAFVSRNTDVVPKGANQSDSGYWFTIEHNYSGFLGQSSNTLAFQWANNLNSNMGNISGIAPSQGFTTKLATGNTDPLSDKNQQLKILDQLLLAPSAQFQILVGGMYQQKTWGNPGFSNITSTQYGLFTRPVYWFSDYFKIQGDLGYTSAKYSNSPVYGTDAATTTKFCIAPTLAPMVGTANGFWMRPEFRLFVTYATWNDASNKMSPTGSSSAIQFGSATSPGTSGTTFGAQVEGWF